MSLVKTFIVSFVVFIILNFLMNLLILIANGTINVVIFFSNIRSLPLHFIGSFFAIMNIGILPPGYNIFYGTILGISWLNSNVFLGIMLILASFLPALIASIIGGKMANTPIQAFIGFISAMILSSIILMILYLINSVEMYSFVTSLTNYLDKSSIAVWIFIFGVFNGLLWSGIAGMMGKEDKIARIKGKEDKIAGIKEKEDKISGMMGKEDKISQREQNN